MIDFQNLDSKVVNLWAKKKTIAGNQLWLPLIAHLYDTEQTIEWLWKNWLSDGTKSIITTKIGNSTAQKLIKFLGFTHDLGKATPAFQLKPAYGGDHTIDHNLLNRLLQAGFIGLNQVNLTSPQNSPHAMAGEALLISAHVPESVAAIIGGHHGDAGSNVPSRQLKVYPENYVQMENSLTKQNWQLAQTEIINLALKTAGFGSVAKIPAITQTQAVLLEGLLIMADWLSSGETLNNDSSKPLFPLIPIEKGLRDLDLNQRFQSAIKAWDFGGDWNPQPVTTDTDPYQSRWGFTARPVQKAITQAIQETTDPGVCIVEAPMGLGKTEIALLAAEQLAYKTNRGGLFVGLPTQATSNAMYSRVQNWLKKLAQHQHENFPMKLMHGKAQFNEDYTKLPEASNVYTDDNGSKTDGAVVVNDWFSGTKSILTKFSVGTIDNLLLMALKQKHLFLRHLGFSEKVVVIDEVHAYDAYMNQYLYEALKWLGAYHVPAVILSATLPKAKRAELLEAYYHGKFSKHSEPQATTADWQTSDAYPLLTLLDGNTIQQVTDFPGTSDQQPLKLTVTRMPADENNLIQSALKSIQNGGVAGIIVNTVQRAQHLAELVPKDIPTIVLHSAFLAPDRAAKETELQNAIGKNATRPAKMIVIGTQVLEQSLDIDFDVLYTDIAPIDLILQRAGRLHRHQIQRPKALQKPKLFVLGATTPGDYGGANEVIYSKYLLMKTDYYLKDQIQLPNDISKLVQQVYDFDTDPDIAGIASAKTDFETKLAQEQSKANEFRLADPNRSRRETLHKWLDRAHINVDRDDQWAAAAVRDIQPSLEVILLQEKAGVIYLLDGTPISQCSSKTIAEQLIRLPASVTREMDKCLNSLTEITQTKFANWQTDKWLNGSLALVLDQNSTTTLNSWQLHYSAETGLKYDK